MICSDPRCLVCSPWEQIEAGYITPNQAIKLSKNKRDTWSALILKN